MIGFIITYDLSFDEKPEKHSKRWDSKGWGHQELTLFTELNDPLLSGYIYN